MANLIETIILYLMLVAFAIVGIFYLAPRIGASIAPIVQPVRIDKVRL